MRYIFGLIAFFFSTTLWSAEQTSNETLEIRPACIENMGCSYAGQTLYIKLDIKRQHDSNIACAFNTLEAQGPYVTLVDATTGKRLGIPSSLPLLEKDLVFVAPPAAVSTLVTTEVYPSQIKYFAQKRVDLWIELSFSIPGKNVLTDERVRCIGKTEIHVTERSDPQAGISDND